MANSLKELMHKAKCLARPRLILRTQAIGEPIAFWNGPAAIPPPADGKSWEHWLSLNCSWLAWNGLAKHGWMSVFITYDDCTCAATWGDQQTPNFGDGIPLYGKTCLGFPPIEFIEEQLPVLQISPDAYAAYDAFYCNRLPQNLDSRVFAVLGGWHMQWPEDDSLYGNGERIVLITTRDSEPWVEVWPNGDAFEAIWRLT